MATKPNSEKSTAPDGGWGWFVVIAYATNNMVVIPIMQIFPLLYGPYMKNNLKMSTTDTSIIIVMNIVFGMLLAIFNGPILRNFGFRKVAIVGALLIFVGNVQTSQANTFWEFLVYFSIFVSTGTDFVMASFNLALNTYFVTRRGVATGIAMTITGLGPILMPLLTVQLMSAFGVHGAGLIIAAISAHSLAAALLLQPIKWHQRKPKDSEIEMKANINGNNAGPWVPGPDPNPNDKKDQYENDDHITVATRLIENETVAPSPNAEAHDEENPLKSLDDVVKRQEATVCERIVKFFDLDLLNDPMYLNISLGLALAFVTEMSFTLMLPLILYHDHAFDYETIGYMLSVLAVSDLSSRFISPFVGESIKQKVRVVYLFSLMAGICFRLCLITFKDLVAVYFIIVMIGLTKGIRSVYTTLVLPTYVPLSKLPAATGLQMVANGIMLGTFAPILGKIKDLTGNFDLWIHIINVAASITVILWFSEMYLVHRHEMNKKPPIVKQVQR